MGAVFLSGTATGKKSGWHVNGIRRICAASAEGLSDSATFSATAADRLPIQFSNLQLLVNLQELPPAESPVT